ncbi:MAG: hypothetical protein V1689_09730 [Pseudomonadota bacterium]
MTQYTARRSERLPASGGLARLRREGNAADHALMVDQVFFIPLTALFLAYILVLNPRWFTKFQNTLDMSPTDL